MPTVSVATARTTNNAGLSTTSGSFAVGATDLIVACVGSNSATLTAVTHTVTDSGGGTWTQRAHADNASQAGRSGAASVWTRALAANGSMTVTATIGGAANGVSLEVYLVSGQNVAPIGATSTGQTTTAATTASIYTNTASGSAAFVAVDDWNATGAATSSDLTMTTYTIAGVVSGLSGFKILGPAGAQTAQFTFPAAPDGVWAALEILDSPTAAALALPQAPPTYGVNLWGPTAVNLADPFALWNEPAQPPPPDTPPQVLAGGARLLAAWSPGALVISTRVAPAAAPDALPVVLVAPVPSRPAPAALPSVDVPLVETPGPEPASGPAGATASSGPGPAPAPVLIRSTTDPAAPPTAPPPPTAPMAGALPAQAPAPVLARSGADPAVTPPPSPAAPPAGRQPTAAPTAVTIRVTADPAVTPDTPPTVVVTRVTTWPPLAAPGPLVAQVRDVTPLQPSASPPVPVVALAGRWPLGAPRELVTYSTADPAPSASPPVAVVPAVQLPPARPVNAATAWSTFTAPDQTLPPVLVARAGTLPPPAARAVVIQSPGQPAPADGLRRLLVVPALRAVAGAALAFLRRAAFDPITPPIVRPGNATAGTRAGAAAGAGSTAATTADAGTRRSTTAGPATRTGTTSTAGNRRGPNAGGGA